MEILALIATLLLSNPESIETPCSVKAKGNDRSPPREFEMPKWHFKP